MNNYPKVLIIGQPFNLNSGGGITISNLFSDWPKDKIALVTDTKNIDRNDFNLCPNAYRLGDKEYKIKFPFNFIFKNKISGQVYKNDPLLNNFNKLSKKRKIYYFFEKVFFYFGLNFIAFRIIPSKYFLNWINKINPDIIYSQLGKLELILFVEKIIRITNKPLVIHIMDDWPSFLAKGFLKIIWQKYINKSFKQILFLSNTNMCISGGMSIEYKKRYKKDFTIFHNPIEIASWKEKKDIHTKEQDKLKILYTGRITSDHYKSVISICKTIQILNKINNITFDIYSPDYDTALAKKVAIYENINLKHPIPHSQMPDLLISYDLLLLPLEFSKRSIKITKYSMPTKAPEYMISGVPILIFASKEVEIVRHANKYQWAIIISSNDQTSIIYGLKDALFNQSLRRMVSHNAIEYSKNHYDAKQVRYNFKNILLSSINIK